MRINPREIDNTILAILAILAMFGTNAKDRKDRYDCDLRGWEKRDLWAPPLLLERQPAEVNPASSVGFKGRGHWTAYAVRYLPKRLISQRFSHHAKLAMSGFLPCSILAEKAKLLKIKEIQK